MKLFAQIRKVDEAKRLVYGRAADESLDKADEIMDYMKSKPHFEKWSADVAADSGGKSLGNLRAMHGKVAAGKLTEIAFDDTAKAIDVCAKVVDDNEWKKVLEGVYTGFSIGGAYGERSVEKMDGRDVKRYVAIPSELSLVDRPCIPSAKFFEVQKADGSLAKVAFAEPEDDTIQGTPEQVTELVKLMKAKGLDLGAVLETLGKADAACADDDANKPGEGAAPVVDDKAKDDKAKADAAAAEAAKAEAAAELQKKADADALAKADADAAAALAKVEADKTAALQKMVDDAVAPLQKALEAANAQIEVLKAQPAPTTVKLRAVSKADDTVQTENQNGGLSKSQLPVPIVDDFGDKHEAAGLIKVLHKHAGMPMTLPVDQLRK